MLTNNEDHKGTGRRHDPRQGRYWIREQDSSKQLQSQADLCLYTGGDIRRKESPFRQDQVSLLWHIRSDITNQISGCKLGAGQTLVFPVLLTSANQKINCYLMCEGIGE